jgi:hypothetical protein
VFNVLGPYSASLPFSRKKSVFKKIFYNLTLKTRALPCFTELYKLFYINNKKVVPKNIFYLLNAVALAH